MYNPNYTDAKHPSSEDIKALKELLNVAPTVKSEWKNKTLVI
jgi:hypothetical protein